MTAISGLGDLLRSMEPVQVPGEFVFVNVAASTSASELRALATVVEDEGMSSVLSQEDADALGLAYDFVAGWITLRVHSALDAVGLTAAVSAALTAGNISCNVIAGRHHDHLLVPIERVDDALAALRALALGAGRVGTVEVTDDEAGLELAKSQARIGRAEGGIPIGAALVADTGEVLGVGYNRRVQLGSATRHGETDALEQAGRLTAAVYARSTMYTTLSPCAMCTGAILLYGIPRVVIGEHRTFLGEEELLRSRGVEVIVLDDGECVAMMEDFIAAESRLWNEDIGEPDV